MADRSNDRASDPESDPESDPKLSSGEGDHDPRAGLDRRALVGGAAAWIGALALSRPGFASEAETPPATSDAPAFELEEATIAELAAGLAGGKWTSQRLVALYRERIESVDRVSRPGGGTNAIAEWNPAAETIAAERDRERKAGRVRGPLHGIPIAIKDNIDTADGMRTTAGSLALAESIASKDAFLVERLRAAGAVIVAKTNLSEWANFRSSRSTSGWSGRGGQVRNPYALDRSPCGSSSGSGAAVAANLCAAAVGTETDGSIVCPASMNGVVGFKPTLGLVSRSGVVPIAASQDTAGPMTRTVSDAVLLLAAMAGVDLPDSATAASAGRWDGAGIQASLAAATSPTPLSGTRLGIVRAWFRFHPEIASQMDAHLALLSSLGAELVDPVEIPHASDVDDDEVEVLLYEFKHGLNRYLSNLPESGQPRTLAALIDWNRAHAEREMPWFGQELFERAEAKGPLSDTAYLDALARCRRLTRAEGIDAVLSGQRLDALVGPTMGPAYLIDWLNGDAFGGSSAGPAAVAGYPHLTVPAGFVHGLPWNLSFVGTAWSEARLIRCGAAFEATAKARRAPSLPSTLTL